MNKWIKLSAVSLSGIIISFGVLWGINQFDQARYYNGYNTQQQSQGNMNAQTGANMNMQSNGMNAQAGAGVNMQTSSNGNSMNMQATPAMNNPQGSGSMGMPMMDMPMMNMPMMDMPMMKDKMMPMMPMM